MAPRNVEAAKRRRASPECNGKTTLLAAKPRRRAPEEHAGKQAGAGAGHEVFDRLAAPAPAGADRPIPLSAEIRLHDRRSAGGTDQVHGNRELPADTGAPA